jgi:hypothetical protein
MTEGRSLLLALRSKESPFRDMIDLCVRRVYNNGCGIAITEDSISLLKRGLK